MKLSIITINYNNRDGLRKTIRSVINQTFKDYEYIVIDGGSCDGSTIVIKEYQEYITYWVSEKDKGIYNAMNKGVHASKGEYCLFLNSGDYFYNESVLEKAFNQKIQADIATSDLITTNGLVMFSPKEVTMDFMFHGSLSHPTSFIKKELLITHPYDERFRIIADREFFLYCLIKLNASYQKLDGITSVFDTTGISSTSSSDTKEIALWNEALQNIIPPRVIADYEIFAGKRDDYHRLFYILSFASKRKWIYYLVVLCLKIFTFNRGLIKDFQLNGKI